ncbi:Multidrug resistance-associated protein 4 [Nowakowskiella sp. JEL0407]|nr:Multidrug resistance-associated protein 4 [Nowakowskiella sp. JEL0407]
MNDFPSIETDDESSNLADRIRKAWDMERETRGDKARLWRSTAKVFGWQYMLAGVAYFLESIVKVAEAVFLGYLLVYFQTPSAPLTDGIIYSVVLSLFVLLHAILHHIEFWLAMRCGMQLRIGFITAIYKKCLQLSIAHTSSSGLIVNIVSNDVQRFEDCSPFLHFIWLGPLEVLIVWYFMYQQIGLASIAAVASILMLIPIQGMIAKRFQTLRKEAVGHRDERIRTISDSLAGIIVVKLYAWEEPFIDRIQERRNDELNTLRKANYLRSFNESFFFASSAFISLFAFITYYLLGGEFTPSRIFTTVALSQINRLSMTNFFPRAFQLGSEAMVSFSRIQDFLSLPEIHHSEDKIQFEEEILNKNSNKDGDQNSSLPMVVFEKASFTWQTSPLETKNSAASSPETPLDPEKPSVRTLLKDLDISVQMGEVLGVCGQVGSGKSSLLHAVLGEMEKVSGNLAVRRQITEGGSTRKIRIAFASQSPWIASGTIKDNILFGQPYDENWFKEVITACALDTDLALLPDRENTVLGERGVTLSGGQRARLSLARAVYFNADIYLLDDPLSAVDTKVGRHLFEKCIMGILRTKARILVSHQLQFIRDCDKVVLLEEGSVVGFGKYEDVMMAQNSRFAVALREFGNKGKAFEGTETEDEGKSKNATKVVYEDATVAPQDMVKEETATGSVGLSVYVKYFTSGAGSVVALLMIGFMVIGEISLLVTDWWLSHWSQDYVINVKRGVILTKIYPLIFFGLVMFAMIAAMTRALIFFEIGLRSGRTLFTKMLNAVVRSPMSFFQFNPHGQLMNRFSKDLNLTDEMVPAVFFDFAQCAFMVIGTLVLSVIIIPWVALTVPFVLGIFFLLRRYFMATSRQVKRIEAVTRSPVYSNVSATLEGLSTIRAFDAEDSRWLGLRLDGLSAVFMLVVTFLSLGLRQSLGLLPGSIGFLLSYSLQLIGLLQWCVRQSAEVENLMVSVERILEYTTIESEAPAITDKRPPDNWPNKGDVSINNLSLIYPNASVPALKNITVHLPPGTRCGIVGRTGAGKSSFLQALFRLVEPTPKTGSVVIDGIDTSTIGLEDLRSNISIIPQEPFCFRGTLRFNVDPFSKYTDQEIWRVLDAVELKRVVELIPEKLQAPVSENGGNWSFGERQLICLARAILRNTKLIVMDEATSSVDLQTDELVQNAIRGRKQLAKVESESSTSTPQQDSLFAEATVITIAHRLQTVIDFDKLMVLNGGSLVEFGSPYELLQKDVKDDSAWFVKMIEEIANEDAKKLLRKIAQEKEMERKKDL